MGRKAVNTDHSWILFLFFKYVHRLPVTPPARSSNYPRVRRRDLICSSFSRWSPGVQYQGRSLGKMETNRASNSFQLRLFFSSPLFIIHLELSNLFWLCLLSWSVLKRLHCRLHCNNFIRSFLENTLFLLLTEINMLVLPCFSLYLR